MFKSSRLKKEQRFKKEQITGAPLVSYDQPKSVYAEQYRGVRTNLEFLNLDKQLQTIVVTSSIPAEGKSTLSANLGYVSGAMDKRVLIVDADMRKPTLHRTFKLPNEKGLSTLISQKDVQISDVVVYRPELNLYLLTSGPIPPNPSELLASAKMDRLVEEMKQLFDLVIFDTPPVGAVADSAIMSTKVDGTVLVVRQGYVHKDEVLNAKETLDKVGARLLGYVVNDQEVDRSSDYAYYGYSEE